MGSAPFSQGYPRRTYAAEPRRRRGGCCAAVALGLFLGALCFFGGVVGLALSRPQRPPEVQNRREVALRRWEQPPASTASPEVKELRRRAEHEAERALERAPTGSGDLRTFTVDVTEDELNTVLARDPEIRKALESQGVKEITVLLQPGRILVDGTITWRGMTLPVSGEAVPAERPDGTFDVRLESLRAGRFPLPADLLREASRNLRAALAQQDPKKGKVRSIRIEDGRATLSGEVSPGLADDLRSRSSGERDRRMD